MNNQYAIELDDPNRLVTVRAQALADAIGAISQLMSELQDRTSEDHRAQINALAALWDVLSEAVEDPDCTGQTRCPQCGKRVTHLQEDPAKQHPIGICADCWNNSI